MMIGSKQWDARLHGTLERPPGEKVLVGLRRTRSR